MKIGLVEMIEQQEKQIKAMKVESKQLKRLQKDYKLQTALLAVERAKVAKLEKELSIRPMKKFLGVE